MRTSRWLIFAPVAILALFAQPVKADVLGDWIYSQSNNCGGSVEVIDNTITLHGPDNGTQQFGMCGGQANWVKIETAIPAGVNTVDFTWAYQTNDGAWYDPPQYGVNGIYTLLTQQNNATGTKSVPVVEGDIFTFRQYSTDTCCQPGHLSISNLSLWEFTATTSTTIQETTTTWTTTTSSTTTTTSTSTTAPSTTVPVTNPSTTTTPQTTSIPLPEPTMPDPPATVPPPQTVIPAIPETMPPPPEIETNPFPQPSPDVVPDPILETVDTIVLPPEIVSFPPDTLELPPEIVDTLPELVVTYPTIYPLDTLPFVEDPPDTMPLPPDMPSDAPETLDTLPPAIIAELPPELVQALLDAGDSDVPLTEEQFTAVVDTISNLAPEEAVALITQILATAVTPDQATALATNPDVLAVITSDQAEEIFATIEVAALDETQVAELTAAVQAAPTKVRKAFEKTINIFGGFDDYVPTGSNIPVGERRTLIAIAAGTTLTAAGSKIKRK